MRRSVGSGITVPLACVLLVIPGLTSCSTGKNAGGQGDELQIVSNPVAATAPVSPVAAAKPAGTVLPAGNIGAIATQDTTRILAVAVGNTVSLHRLDDPGPAPAVITLDGPVENLTTGTGELLASIPSRGEIARIALPGGKITTIPVAGAPADAIPGASGTLVAVRDRKAIDLLDGGTALKTITGGLYSADRIVGTGTGTVVLDRLRNAVFTVDVPGGTIGHGLRAGDGATNAVADSYGRVLVTDTRGGALLAFSTSPLLLRQRYPVPGGIYAIAYDPARGLAWVTLTERNEVVGFDVRGGEPTEKYRFPTIRQPNSIAVDERNARVFVGSATGEGIQVIQP